ncbi:helicase associated domain-containing protein [Saitoella complicata NRRL Y-17804]|uniref:RNA helicase n=1 Tax=Saitoella complicata (strain BCRC 22490 / CBS 7301 / JCM 7358 / NBRC 10748 / NRRL Y-17804) TaxID=698492 RepID=A0A0E9NI01_SAICN|nr:helicase associated domain-containing protein [Saitoella complicata NRRL Y-17804]ODQ52998.1 helicase associated domain-containing protein [Saitoella complicata NRRL Y-17804]GAO49035.1 hypothetical protein G7K_3196-t1 [Saitoella complicata NRRL Y-17804]
MFAHQPPPASITSNIVSADAEAPLPGSALNELARFSLQRQRELLPIFRHRKSLLYLVETKPVTIVVGHTGSGKTTQLPQYLHEAGWTQDGKIIACTQPRRVAATTVATRVAEEVGCTLGQEVGYSIRFEDVTSDKTRIKYMTDGMLLREALVDPLLTRYRVIMLDEAHERTVYTDILLGVLKKIRKRRKDLRLVISSATLDAEEFKAYFEKDKNAAEEEVSGIISLEGKMFPVDVMYLEEPTENYVEKAIETVFEITARERSGDILLFLTGRDEIERTAELIAERATNLPPNREQLLVLPLYAGLPTDRQLAVFEPTPEGVRKVIVSTNIAEASVTIDGIAFVIDCGFVKLRAYNPLTGMESLTVASISKASAAQRAGRAGRTKPGKCFRLYTQAAYDTLAPTSVPEIQRSDLAPVILQLKALGIDNVARFDFMTPPPAEMMVRALELLYSLGTLDDYGKLTQPLGLQMAEFPVEPMMARILLSSNDFGCGEQILTIAAMTSVQNVFVTPEGEKKVAESAKRKFTVEEGDHMTLLNVYHSYTSQPRERAVKWCHQHFLNHKALIKAVSIRAQLRRYMERFNIPIRSASPETAVHDIRRCLVSGYFAHAARMQPDGTYKMIKGGETLWAHPTSVMFNRKADWIVFYEIVETDKKIFIRDITKIEKEWLAELAPHYYEVKGKKTLEYM